MRILGTTIGGFGGTIPNAITVAIAAVPLTILALSCKPDVKECTPDSAGRGGLARIETRDLQSPDQGKGGCGTYIKVVRNQEQLLAEYQRVGLAPKDPDAGGDAGSEFGLPDVNFLKESVIVFGSPRPDSIAWAVRDGELVVLGLRSCVEHEGECTERFVSVDGIITRVERYSCDQPSCNIPTNQ